MSLFELIAVGILVLAAASYAVRALFAVGAGRARCPGCSGTGPCSPDPAPGADCGEEEPPAPKP